MPESDRNSLDGLFSLRARLSSKTGSVQPVRFDRHIQDGGRSKKNGARQIFQCAVTLEIMVGIVPNLGHRGTSGVPSIFHIFTLV